MSLFPISKRLTFFGLFRICSFQGTCSLRSHADRTAFAGAWPTRDLLRRHLAGCSPRNVFFILLKSFD